MAMMKISEEIRITDLETLKVISAPLRFQILERIGLASDSGQLTTVKQLSEDLEIPPTKLYYHINLLEKYGLIQIPETRVVSGIIEKYYQIAAQRIRVDLDISKNTKIDRNEGMALAISSISAMFDTAQLNVEKSFKFRLEETQVGEPEPVAMLTSQTSLQISPEQAQDFITRLNELIGEFEEIENPGGLAFGLTVLFNPNYHIKIPQTEEQTSGPGNFQDELTNIEKTSVRIPPQL